MDKYSIFNSIQDSVDLHNLNGPNRGVQPEDVWNMLDNFFHTMEYKYAQKLKRGITIKLAIIVGKGTRTKNWINGKNPLRAYTEEYLDHCGYIWRNGRYGEGEEGVIVVDFN